MNQMNMMRTWWEQVNSPIIPIGRSMRIAMSVSEGPYCGVGSTSYAPPLVGEVPLPGRALLRDLTLIARKGEYGSLPQRMAGTVAEIFDRDWRPALAHIAPWLAAAVAVDQSAANRRPAISS